MASLPFSRPRQRVHDFSLAAKSIAGFWIFYLLTILVRSLVMGDNLAELAGRRLLGIIVGTGLTFLVYLALRLFAAHGSLRRMVIVAALACIPAAIAFSAFSFLAVQMYQPIISREMTEKTKDGTVLTRKPGGEISIRTRGQKPMIVQAESTRDVIMQQAPRFIADGAISWYFFFAAWASFYVAMSSANQLRLAERRASEFERAAQSAQLRALRYQVNPHFLFNTLNSLSSLVMARREDEAERMIMNLSNFFRSTLSIDPAADVTLSEEIALQMLYLDIEKARFPKRLKVEVDIPAELQMARVPALLLQPVVENAIKYGVSRAKGAVTLGISAKEKGVGRLLLTVQNSGDAAAVVPAIGEEGPSTGVGLPNVCQRLAARFGDSASCEYGPRDEGGFRVAITMPIVKHV